MIAILAESVIQACTFQIKNFTMREVKFAQ